MLRRCGKAVVCPVLVSSAMAFGVSGVFAADTSLATQIEPDDADQAGLGQPDDISLRLGLGPGRLGAFTGGTGQGSRSGPWMVTGELLLDLPFSDHIGFELVGRFGTNPSEGATSLVGLGLGLRAGFDLGAGFSAQTSARLFHIHDAPNKAWLDATGPTLAGDPEFGLAHITAAGGAFGMAWELPGTDRRLLVTVDIEVLGRLHGHGNRALPSLWVTAPVGLRWRI